MPTDDVPDHLRIQSCEERAVIRRVRKLREQDAAIQRGEHIPTFSENMERLIAATGRVGTAMHNWRVRLETEQLAKRQD
jgi:hypothetical protein